MEEVKTCRICFDGDNSNGMISPCRCKGHLKWVHVECFIKWILVSPHPGRCELCTFEMARGVRQEAVTQGTFFDTNAFFEDIKFAFQVAKGVMNHIYTSR